MAGILPRALSRESGAIEAVQSRGHLRVLTILAAAVGRLPRRRAGLGVRPLRGLRLGAHEGFRLQGDGVGQQGKGVALHAEAGRPFLADPAVPRRSASSMGRAGMPDLPWCTQSNTATP